MKLLDIAWNWSLSPMNFSISLPKMLSKIISLKNLDMLYEDLLGFRITMVVEILKWNGQWPKSKHALVILIILFKQTLSLNTYLRWLHDSLFRPGVDELLHLASTFINFSFENRSQEKGDIESISLRTSTSML